MFSFFLAFLEFNVGKFLNWLESWYFQCILKSSRSRKWLLEWHLPFTANILIVSLNLSGFLKKFCCCCFLVECKFGFPFKNAKLALVVVNFWNLKFLSLLIFDRKIHIENQGFMKHFRPKIPNKNAWFIEQSINYVKKLLKF